MLLLVASWIIKQNYSQWTTYLFWTTLPPNSCIRNIHSFRKMLQPPSMHIHTIKKQAIQTCDRLNIKQDATMNSSNTAPNTPLQLHLMNKKLTETKKLTQKKHITQNIKYARNHQQCYHTFQSISQIKPPIRNANSLLQNNSLHKNQPHTKKMQKL